MDIRILFMGSDAFSGPHLRALRDSYSVSAVITQPDKPSGRGRALEAPLIKPLALELGLAVYQPEKISRDALLSILENHPVELIVVAAYGKILPAWLLDYPKYGAINVHASLLPRWRGASPIQAAILHGDEETGVTIMQMEAGLDSGGILASRPLAILPEDTAATLSSRLAELGASLLTGAIQAYVQGEIAPQPQDPEKATWAHLISKEDARLDFNQPAELLERKIRAYNPWPICFYEWDSQYLRIYRAKLSGNRTLKPNQRGIIEKYPCVGTETDALILETVQPSGKSRMDGKAFLNGAKNWAAKA